MISKVGAEGKMYSEFHLPYLVLQDTSTLFVAGKYRSLSFAFYFTPTTFHDILNLRNLREMLSQLLLFDGLLFFGVLLRVPCFLYQ